MHRTLSSRWLRGALSAGDRAALAEFPSYLCPALSAPAVRTNFNTAPATMNRRIHPAAQQQHRCLHVRSATEDPVESEALQDTEPEKKRLPTQCHGCGGFAQSTDPSQAGYYNMERQAVKKFLGQEKTKGKSLNKEQEEDLIVDQALGNLDPAMLAELGLDPKTLKHGDELDPHGTILPQPLSPTPLCDRCHKLVHERIGAPIFHPTTDALRDTIEESPFKFNHVYHVIDAADFPMSLIPRLHQLLGDITLRHKNRRSRHGRYYNDRQIDMSFVITRADLLAPTEKQVNSLMPWMREVLRDALGDIGQSIRLGNVSCVSAKRSWWTKELKQDIYQRGGAGWMVGKVNVGKSQLFEAVFPKGTTMETKASLSGKPVEVSMFARDEDVATYLLDQEPESDDGRLDVGALLPPARPETNYPEMPTVSSLAGTTASPIRIPYGNGKGELIDLPGLARSDLELFVQEDMRQSLIMQKRIKPEQHSMTGKSLILGGLIRITPRTPGLVFLGYNFTTLEDHLTGTGKAESFLAQTRPIEGLTNIATPEAAQKMAHAGAFKLRHDVTRARAAPITRSDAIGIKVDKLPYRVLSTDILIEGVGWVEITAQIRLKDLERPQQHTELPPPRNQVTEPAKPKDPFAAMESLLADGRGGKKQSAAPAREVRRPEPENPKEPELNWPIVDVYSPLGKFIGQRAPMNGWLLNKPLNKNTKGRPRKSMKGVKKNTKKLAREAASRVVMM
ncbi:hypothetical protein F5X68DRAFT_157613 [Plectosphaerella plurivora]|uniref:Genetic interactor of prohibitins 3, mitochondrial n=1 Tax=Plectosphaerella plurivora TaxID=936078 RepID=A0A9P8V4Z7_9PEZI|nr:hypothetical protein F5X68DRAFT_157613 [Plectosphaerella plurivora]